jgi:superfamily I DNA and/or RNA helicase
LSIGVIAFSEAQQGEIESAMKSLAAQDSQFAALLDAASEREEDGQFCGLFVKNLENVQGDERDLIILSICYGFDRDRKMLMNFGPINKAGGEKRLNVVFSRAKRHMVVVSGIRYPDIRNDYNPGAFVFRSYLQYAELHSRGDWKGARQVLDLLGSKRNQRGTLPVHPMARQIGEALQERGYAIEFNIGQSSLRCDVGVRRTDENHYCLGILLDTEQHYANPDLLERYLQQPELMRNFDWPLKRVFAKDWSENRDQVIKELATFLERQFATESVVLR